MFKIVCHKRQRKTEGTDQLKDILWFTDILRVCSAASVLSTSLRPRGLQPSRLLCPWDSPGKKTGVGCNALPSRESSQPKDQTQVFHTAGGFGLVALFLVFF